MTMRVDGEITIDSQGQVTQYKVTTPITPTIAKAVDAAVRDWKFHTVEVDGRPANARSIMRVTLAGRQASNGYAISVDNVTFRAVPEDAPLKPGEVRSKKGVAVGQGVVIASTSMQAPEYPLAPLQAGIEGAVLLYVKVNPDGRADQVVAVQSTLYNIRGRPRMLQAMRKLLEGSAVSSIERWRFDVRLNGRTPTPADLTATVSVAYGGLHDSDAPGQWRVETRSAWSVAPWLADQRMAQQIKVSDVVAGEIMQVASAFQPPQGVIGKEL